MSKRDDGVYLGHMLDAARKILDRTAQLSRGEFEADEFLRLALVHLVQIVGEAARLLQRSRGIVIAAGRPRP